MLYGLKIWTVSPHDTIVFLCGFLTPFFALPFRRLYLDDSKYDDDDAVYCVLAGTAGVETTATYLGPAKELRRGPKGKRRLF